MSKTGGWDGKGPEYIKEVLGIKYEFMNGYHDKLRPNDKDKPKPDAK